MALEYGLYIQTDLNPERVMKLIFTSLGVDARIEKSKKRGVFFFTHASGLTTWAYRFKDNEPSLIAADLGIEAPMLILFHLDKFEDMRVDLFYLFEYLKDLQLTSFIINEMPAGDERYSQYGVESYLVDGVIQLALSKRELKVKRELNIVKMRYADHMTNIFVFQFDKKQKRFVISEKIAVE